MLIKRAIRKTKVAGAILALMLTLLSATPVAYAGCPAPQTAPKGVYKCCGQGSNAYQPSLELGCRQKGDPILDLVFAFVRFLSYGVGLVIVASLTYAGIQYTGSRGDPNANALAVKRIQANVTALLIFVFSFALIDYVVPGQLLK